MIAILLFTLTVFAAAMLVMSVGVLFSGRCLRGSCGGPDVLGPGGESLSCATCPRRREREEAGAGADGSLPVLQE
ncbi:MAG TPA: hypothetical protein VGG06_35035 [Thermoanaerobaculia bacterium]|jgi:hypothetical protein